MKRGRARLIRFLGISVVLAFSLFLFSDDSRAQPTPVRWGIKIDSVARTLKPGRTFSVQVTAQIAEGWYFYSITQPKGGPIRTTFSVPTDQPFRLAGSIKGPKPKVKFDKTFGINVETYEGTAVFTVPVRAVRSGKHKLVVSVRYQSCNGEICLQPRTDRLELEL